MQSFNIIDMWGHMGLLDQAIVALLVGMSMYSIWIMIDRVLAYRKASKATLAFVGKLRGQLQEGDLEAAADTAKAQPDSPAARVVEGVLAEYQLGAEMITRAGSDELDLDVVDAINREIARVKETEVSKLKRGLSGLASISSASPFIGLFGTVVGIINAFRSMAESGQGGLGAVSAGIAEALFTTATGLVVAIPALMAFNYFTSQTEHFVLAMNDVSSQLLNHVLRSAKTQKRAAA
jgi:biopolymer transport protein ExbB/TolQ